MRSTLLPFVAAALALFATSARAEDYSEPIAGPARAAWYDPADIVTPDATYAGPHAVFVKDYQPRPELAAVATSESAWELSADAPALAIAPAPVRPEPTAAAPMVAIHDCDCSATCAHHR
jgi:hypothetical protein